jgi:hypothetical protein
MNNISEHITYAEATVSDTGSRLGIVNAPTPEIITTMQMTAERLFEPLRAHFGVPIRVLSFYRCPALNKAVGGARNSQHMYGEAIDIQGTEHVSNSMIFHYLLTRPLVYDQIIHEFGSETNPDWVHISFTAKRTNRQEALRAKRIGNKTVYLPFAEME